MFVFGAAPARGPDAEVPGQHQDRQWWKVSRGQGLQLGDHVSIVRGVSGDVWQMAKSAQPFVLGIEHDDPRVWRCSEDVEHQGDEPSEFFGHRRGRKQNRAVNRQGVIPNLNPAASYSPSLERDLLPELGQFAQPSVGDADRHQTLGAEAARWDGDGNDAIALKAHQKVGLTCQPLLRVSEDDTRSWS